MMPANPNTNGNDPFATDLQISPALVLFLLPVLTFLGTWNDYLWPLIVLRTMEKYTLPIGLASLFGLYKIEYGMILAGAFLGTLPILALFIIGRRQFIDGIAAGAVKG
jgi:ABC-type glycerol-3-phosphate transport system permease component